MAEITQLGAEYPFEEPRLTKDMILQVVTFQQKYRPRDSIKPKSMQMVDQRYDAIGAELRHRNGTFYFQFEDDTIFVSTARFDGEKLVEMYRRPEYMMPWEQSVVEHYDIQFNPMASYVSHDPKTRAPIDIYFPLRGDGRLWIYETFGVSLPGERGDAYIVRFPYGLMTPNTFYHAPQYSDESMYDIRYYDRDGNFRALLHGRPYALEDILWPR